MDIKKNRNKMWTFLVLYILDVNFCQATERGNSTQMLYAKLIIDQNAIPNVTAILQPFGNDSLHVDRPTMTTNCTYEGMKKNCLCEPGHIWSEDLCRSDLKCCDNNKCQLAENSSEKCILNTTVAIMGILRLTGHTYQNCLLDRGTKDYEECKRKLLVQMKEVYSTLRGFDSLKITQFRVGSIITEFDMVIASTINSQELINKSQDLSLNLSAALNLETTGVVRLIMPPSPVCYENSTNITCTSDEDLGDSPVWRIKNANGESIIVNGTVSTVTTLSSKSSSRLELKQVSELWKGEYVCVYEQKKNCNKTTNECLITISHKARAELDISLLPNIDASTEPSFPRCTSTLDVLNIQAKCEIRNDTENYTVEWEGVAISKRSKTDRGETLVYTADKLINCAGNDSAALKCIFKNRCNQTRFASVPLLIIKAGDPFCSAENDWGDTKAGFTALLKCKNSAGKRKRECIENNRWGPEVSECVNSDLNNVLENALISDTGLGLLSENAAKIFSILKNVTNKTETINSFANVNASVAVLSTMSLKLKNVNETTANDLLDSSSNLLEESLESAWKSAKPDRNFTLAERYLTSVENLIEISAINSSKKNHLQVVACTNEPCTNTVFNVTVNLQNKGNALVKTAGFRNLENYLPNNRVNVEPNSIVVSTTTERKNDIKITINFDLLKPRPRDVQIDCVFWENTTGNWSTGGCEWGGPSDPGKCTCNHLSSFAILMSKEAIKIPWENEITYVGLSASVFSLIISLMIELIVWSDVVKTNTLYLRHIAHVNISLCLLVADCCFLASSEPEHISDLWCKTVSLLKHFCYLAMFFWMLCLSSVLLHQAIFLFHKVSKKNYLRFSLILGYACPLLIVFITFLTNQGGAEGSYYDKKTCWLVFKGLLKGTIFTFILPVGTIIFVNVFSMLVVIMKLLEHKNTERSNEKEKMAAKTVVRSVILLTPVFGVTWIFGFAVFVLDLTAGAVTLAAHYAFILLNAFQGLFILLTTCLMDRMTREALLNRLKKKIPATISDSTTKLETKSKQ